VGVDGARPPRGQHLATPRGDGCGLWAGAALLQLPPGPLIPGPRRAARVPPRPRVQPAAGQGSHCPPGAHWRVLSAKAYAADDAEQPSVQQLVGKKTGFAGGCKLSPFPRARPLWAQRRTPTGHSTGPPLGTELDHRWAQSWTPALHRAGPRWTLTPQRQLLPLSCPLPTLR